MPAGRVLLVSLEGADWRMIQPLLDAGKLPNLERLISRGVMGNLAAPQPLVDPLLLTTLVTGRSAEAHGILDFLKPAQPDSVELMTVADRRCPAIWNIASAAGKSVLVVGWPQIPAEPVAGVYATHLFAHAKEGSAAADALCGSIHPKELAVSLADLRIRPEEIGAEEIMEFVPRAGLVDQKRDRRLAAIAILLAETATVHAVATHQLEAQPFDLALVHYDVIDRFGHLFMPCHPPACVGVSAADEAIYGNVMRAVYRFGDAMLGRLLELVGEEANVLLVSPHGFHSDHLRPDSTRQNRSDIRWHRDQGILVLAGDGIREDEWIWGARPLDITPTVLSLLGLPIGSDMNGQPLFQAFLGSPRVECIPSWDSEVELAVPDVSQEILVAERERLVEQGFVDADDLAGEGASRRARDRHRLRLALVQIHEGKLEEAAALLTALREDDPNSDEIALHLARCLQDLGRLDESRRLVQDVVGRGVPRGKAELLLSTLAYAEGDFETALEHLLAADAAEPGQPALHCHIGEVYLKTSRWEEADRAFTKALELDTDCARAHHGLSVSALARDRFTEAAEHALDAIGLQFNLPLAHYHLGVALTRSGDRARGRQAFETCLRLAPQNHLALRWLQELFAGDLKAAEVRDRPRTD